jgi:hypothetical protein
VRNLLLVAAGIAAATLQLAHGQDDSASRRTADTELFYRGDTPPDPNYGRDYGRVDRFEQLLETHHSPGEDGPGTLPDRWWTQ